MTGSDGLDGQEKLEGVFGNCQESVTRIELSGSVILGVNKEADHTRLFGDESSSMHRFGKQQFSVSLLLFFA
jgi:hypothetical protein